MLFDQFSFPDKGIGDTQIFNAMGLAVNPATSAGWARWKKPHGCTFVSMLAVSGGGGGGNGFSRTAGTAGGGGGGGGAGALVSLIMPAQFVPEDLFIFVGLGGPGNGATGTPGGSTCISPIPASTSGIAFIIVGGANGGNTGNNTGAVLGGAGGAGLVGGAALLWPHATPPSQTGSAGGTALGGAGQTNGGTTADFFPFGAGTGGGGTNSATNFAGGSFTSLNTAFWPNVPGGAAAGGNGQDGIQFNDRFEFTGGAGGGSNNSGTGGLGGMGGTGCGGGGGGGGVTGGSGGRGGDGIVVIISL